MHARRVNGFMSIAKDEAPFQDISSLFQPIPKRSGNLASALNLCSSSGTGSADVTRCGLP